MTELTYEVTIKGEPDEGEPSPTEADIASAVEDGLAMSDFDNWEARARALQ